MPLLALLALFIAVPLAELYVIIKVGEAIGALPTIGLLLADALLGSMLLRSQGRAVWRRFTTAMNAGRIPTREAVDGALVVLGGALLLTPGFITDVFGVVFLVPPTRALVRRLAARALRRRVMRRARGRASAPRRPYDVDGTATEQERQPASGDAPRLRG